MTTLETVQRQVKCGQLIYSPISSKIVSQPCGYYINQIKQCCWSRSIFIDNRRLYGYWLHFVFHISLSCFGRLGECCFSWEQISVKFESEFSHFHSRKCIWTCHLPIWQPFCPGADEISHQNVPDDLFVNLHGLPRTTSRAPQIWDKLAPMINPYGGHSSLGLPSSILIYKLHYKQYSCGKTRVSHKNFGKLKMVSGNISTKSISLQDKSKIQNW